MWLNKEDILYIWLIIRSMILKIYIWNIQRYHCLLSCIKSSFLSIAIILLIYFLVKFVQTFQIFNIFFKKLELDGRTNLLLFKRPFISHFSEILSLSQLYSYHNVFSLSFVLVKIYMPAPYHPDFMQCGYSLT